MWLSVLFCAFLLMVKLSAVKKTMVKKGRNLSLRAELQFARKKKKAMPVMTTALVNCI